LLDTLRKNVRWVYVTQDDLPNPWDTLPTYLDQLFSAVAAGGGGGGTAVGTTFTPAGSIAATNVQTALVEVDAEKEPTIAAGTTAQYWRGDKSFQTLDKAAVGLGNVDNTSDANKPVSTAQATADALKVAKAGDAMGGSLYWGGASSGTPGLGNAVTGGVLVNTGSGAGITVSNSSASVAYFNQNIDGPLISLLRSGAYVGNIYVTTTTTAYNTTSDARLKDEFQSFDAGRIVDDTEVFSFRWKSTGERSYGVSAQQAQDVFPQAVTYVEKEDWYGIDYSKYVPVLLQELKALRARVAQLEGVAGIKPTSGL
jgi:hypothetical protein